MTRRASGFVAVGRYAVASPSRSWKYIIAKPIGINQLRSLCKTTIDQTDRKVEQQPYSRDNSPNCTRPLIPASSTNVGLDNPHDFSESRRSIQEPIPERGDSRVKKKGRLLKVPKAPQRVNVLALVRRKAIEDGCTPKELGTLRRTGRYSFLQPEKVKKVFVKGGFSIEETEILKEMRKESVHTRLIADRLGRKESVVKAKIRHLAEYFSEHNQTSFFEGPQALSPEMVASIFHSRLMTIWAGLMSFRRTRQWDDKISQLPSETWLSLITEHTPKRFRSLLSSYQPPTIAQLESLDWSDTSDAGVLGWVLKPKKKSVYFDNECYLYLGSASRLGRGLSYRSHGLRSTWPGPQQECTPKPEMKYHGLSPTGKFITLFTIPFKNDSMEEVQRTRTLVTLARAIFVIWLGAVKEDSKLAVEDLVPWGGKDISYHGFASHNPLCRDLPHVNEKT